MESKVESLCERLTANNANFEVFTWPGIDDEDEWLSAEQVDRICNALKHNRTVEEISFGASTLCKRACLRLASALTVHPTVKMLFFAESMNIEEFGPLAIAMSQSDSLTRLCFMDCTLTQSIIEGVSFLLDENFLQHLEIVGCHTPEGQEYDLSGSLARNKSMKYFEYSVEAGSESHFDFETAREIPRMLRNNHVIRDMTVMLQCVPGMNAKSTACNIFEAASGHVSLQALSVGCQRFTPDQQHDEEENVACDALGRSISDMLQNSPYLTFLDLSKIALAEVDANHVAQGLALNTSIRHLFISPRTIDGGISTIVEALGTNNCLRGLSVFHPGQDSGGMDSLCRMLTVNTSLRHLHVVGEMDSPKTHFLQSLSAYLPQMRGLKTCTLDFYRDSLATATFTDEQESKLVSALAQNKTLEEICCRNFISKETKALVDYYTNLNRGGRRVLGSQEEMPRSFWPTLLAKSSHKPDVLYFFLREKHDVLVSQNHRERPSRKKRKREHMS